MLFNHHLRQIFALVTLSLFPYIAIAAAINVVAAENVYGNIVSQLGGDAVNVVNIINTPQQDPHLFTLTPSTAEKITAAKIIIYSGADYDPWIKPVLTAKIANQAFIIDVAKMSGIKSGANPHIWYSPEIILHFAQSVSALLTQIDPQKQKYFSQRLNTFMQDYQALDKKIQKIKNQYPHVAIIATEPIFNYMSEALGLEMRGIQFQISNMNDVPPSISDIKAFEDDLRKHNVKVLIYNKQVSNPLTERMLAIARSANIPIVGMSEMMPNNMNYFQWMEAQLDELTKALENKTSSNP